MCVQWSERAEAHGVVHDVQKRFASYLLKVCEDVGHLDASMELVRERLEVSGSTKDLAEVDGLCKETDRMKDGLATFGQELDRSEEALNALSVDNSAIDLTTKLATEYPLVLPPVSHAHYSL